MPLCILSALISRRANRSPTSARSPTKLYFPPGGHTHDRHSIPPDQLRVSLSDPILVAAEERLSSASQKSGDDNGAQKAVGPWRMATSTQETSSGHLLKTGSQGAALQDQSLPDSSDDSYDITEVMSMSFIDVSPGNVDNSPSENSHRDLAPLASETFREELYTRGYLKRPASRPASVVPRKSLMLMNCKVFPKVLGRREGRKIAETMRTEEDALNHPNGPHAHLSEKRSSIVASVTLRTPRAEGLESPGMDTNTSGSESYDLHEFSYLTAFTTPPSSPSVVLDVETLQAGICHADSKLAV